MNPNDIARRFGTPAYVYDLAEVRASYRRLRGVLPEARLYYALKANPHPVLVAALADLGCGAEVSSPAELDVAQAAGVPARHCLYTGPAKTPDELRYAMGQAVTWFVGESAVDLRRIEAAAMATAGPVDVAVRLNPVWSGAGASLAMAGGPSQFGIELDQLIAAGAAILPRGVRGLGLHVFLGSNIGRVEDLVAAATVAAEAAIVAARALGRPVDLVDLGGGFPTPYATDQPPVDLTGLSEPLATIAKRLRAEPSFEDATLAFESGRYLVGTAGHLLTRVLDIKRSHGQRVVVVDSGVHHLGGMQGLRRLHTLNPVVDDERERGERATGILAGPLCTPLDRWIDGRALPDVTVGDVIRIPNVGAYGLTASLLGFLSRDAPWEIVVDGDDVVHVSRLVLERYRTPSWHADETTRLGVR